MMQQPDFGPDANLDVPMEQKLGESHFPRKKALPVRTRDSGPGASSKQDI
jgi:hypothetical protein